MPRIRSYLEFRRGTKFTIALFRSLPLSHTSYARVDTLVTYNRNRHLNACQKFLGEFVRVCWNVSEQFVSVRAERRRERRGGWATTQRRPLGGK